MTFERGTGVAYRDRKHLFLSGTASIDPEGTILYEGDVAKQLARTLENMDSLLAAGGGSLQDMNQFTVYLRDPCDHDLARGVMRERFGDVPMAVVVGPVCRPGWLIDPAGTRAATSRDGVRLRGRPGPREAPIDGAGGLGAE